MVLHGRSILETVPTAPAPVASDQHTGTHTEFIQSWLANSDLTVGTTGYIIVQMLFVHQAQPPG